MKILKTGQDVLETVEVNTRMLVYDLPFEDTARCLKVTKITVTEDPVTKNAKILVNYLVTWSSYSEDALVCDEEYPWYTEGFTELCQVYTINEDEYITLMLGNYQILNDLKSEKNTEQY